MLKGKSILVGITGSVAAYKAIELIKGLKNEGAFVSVIMTEASKYFVTPMSVEIAASPGPVVYDMFETRLAHIERPRNAELFIVAPATANTISKYANAIADNLLTAALLAYNGKVIMAPAMNWRMWENPLFQRNMKRIISAGVEIVEPETGALACGEEGPGRMAEVEKIIEAARAAFTARDLEAEHVLVTAGPTREYLDPVRFISNRSSGKMGYALARIARRRGAKVTLISGPTSLCAPDDIEVVPVETAVQMHKAVMERIKEASIFIMCAAVADFAPEKTELNKLDKDAVDGITLKMNPDILLETSKLSHRPFVVGFSAETGQRLERAKKKMRQKKADLFVFNDVTKKGSGFDADTNEVVLLDAMAEQALPQMKKDEVARAIFDRILQIKNLKSKNKN